MNLSELTIGIAMTGSFCTLSSVVSQTEQLVHLGINVIPIFSSHAQVTDTRFGKASDWMKRMTQLTQATPICTIEEAEPLGPSNKLDVLVIAPCTGNTLAKLTAGITDTPVLMAAKGHLRNNKPLIICLASNDALGMNLKNIGVLLNSKNIYFVPFYQDDFLKKPNSLISDPTLLLPTIESALAGNQLQPIIVSKPKE